MSQKPFIDAHQHVWKYSEREYSWITPDITHLLGHDYVQEQVNPSIANFGITGTVYVQAADTYDDTFYMFHSASKNPQIAGIVGWVPLDRTEEAIAALDIFTKNPLFKGVRNLTHDYGNPKYESDDAWIVREPVLKTLGEIASRNLSFDYVAIKPEHTKNVATIAKRHPNLTIIIDHFAKPDIKGGQWDNWLVEMQKVAAFPNVYTKFSGLNVLSDWEKWTIEDWRPYVMAMKESFGTSRMMMGSDWPFSSMANDYDTVWKAQLELIKDFSETEIDDLKYKTAIKAYRL